MYIIFLNLFLLQYLTGISSTTISIPVIHNASLQISGYNSTIIHGTCGQCICKMLLKHISISSFNCIRHNKTCEIFFEPLNATLFSFTNNTTSSVYFISLPSDSVMLENTSIGQDTSSSLRTLLMFSSPLETSDQKIVQIRNYLGRS